MPINPQAQAVLDMIAEAEANGAPRAGEIDALELRKIYKNTRTAYAPKAPEMQLVKDISVKCGETNVPIRFYRPFNLDNYETVPVHIYFHGGGWTIGDIETHDAVCRLLADAGQFSVISVDYSLAPEHKFPAAVEDAWEILKWVSNGKGDYLGINSKAVSVGGDSAGGNLATVISIMARNANINLLCQALIYPATNFHMDSDSQRRFSDGYFLTNQGQKWYHSQYLNGDEDRLDWRASPILADNLNDVAPAFILTCGFDPLLDDGAAYSEKLRGDGVPVKYSCFEGQIHGFITMGGLIDEALIAINDVAAFICQYCKN